MKEVTNPRILQSVYSRMNIEVMRVKYKAIMRNMESGEASVFPLGAMAIWSMEKGGYMEVTGLAWHNNRTIFSLK